MMKYDPFPYQIEGAEFLLSHKRCGLHDEMGIGKTATTITAIDELVKQRGSVRGIIVAPAMLRQNWINEFKKFSRTEPRLVKGVTVHDFVAWTRGHYDILITSYEMATKWAKDYAETYEPLDFVAMDEAHFVKNWKANRTRAMFGYLCRGNNCWTAYSEYVWHITGTPMSNDVFDIFPFLSMVGETDLSPGRFASRYFDVIQTQYGTKYEIMSSQVQGLRDMIARNRIARTASDVGMQLPPVLMTEMHVDGDTKPIKDQIRAWPGCEAIILAAIENGGLSQLDAHHIATLRRLIGSAKVIPYGKILAEELAVTTSKRVVFCCHTTPAMDLWKILDKAGIKAVVVNGSTDEDGRQQAVKDFQNDPELRVFIGNIRVAGTGLTLTASDHVDMLESDWTPAGNAQAIKRVHRHGQTSNRVTARFITLANSLDVRVNESVKKKTEDIALVDGRTMTSTIGVL